MTKYERGNTILNQGDLLLVKQWVFSSYAAKVLNKSIQVMQEEGYDLSILFGIPNFYHRFGYISVLPEYTLQILTRSAEKAPLIYSVRPFEIKDKETVLDIYHQENSLRTEEFRGFRRL